MNNATETRGVLSVAAAARILGIKVSTMQTYIGARVVEPVIRQRKVILGVKAASVLAYKQRRDENVLRHQTAKQTRTEAKRNAAVAASQAASRMKEERDAAIAERDALAAKLLDLTSTIQDYVKATTAVSNA